MPNDPRVRVHGVSVSLDGYAAGPDQSVDHPLGVGGERLHEWAFATRTFRETHGDGRSTRRAARTCASAVVRRRSSSTSAPG
jgi:ribosomal protein L2